MWCILIGILLGALIEQSYPFVGNTFEWIKNKLNQRR